MTLLTPNDLSLQDHSDLASVVVLHQLDLRLCSTVLNLGETMDILHQPLLLFHLTLYYRIRFVRFSWMVLKSTKIHLRYIA